MPNAKRIVSIEVLRVLAMFLIVLTHGFIWGMPFQSPKSTIGFNNVLFPLFSALTSFSVNCFIIISAFFLSRSYSLKFKKAFKIWLQTFFYSAILWVIFKFVTKTTDTSFITAVPPVVNNMYWFVKEYLILLILSPFLAILCDNLDKKSYLILLSILFVITTAIVSKFPLGKILFGDSHTPTFMFLFFLAGYIARFDLPSVIENNCGKFFIAIILIQWLGGLFINYWYRDTGLVYGSFSNSGNGLPIFSSAALLIWCKKQDWSDNAVAKGIAQLAPYMFGVYLIHDNLFVRPFLWEKMTAYDYWDSYQFYPRLLGACLIIFFVCIAIDFVRSFIFSFSGRFVKEKSIE